MSVPGLYRFVQAATFSFHTWRLSKTRFCNPKTLDVAIMDPSKALKKRVGMLQVKVLQAMKLKISWVKFDPHVKVKLTEDKIPSKKTTVKRSNLNPEWNEGFHLVVKDPASQALELNCYD